MATLLLIVIYTAFINLGLPDSILGSSWPSIYVELNVAKDALSYVSLVGTVFSIAMSFFAGKLIKKIGTPLISAISVTLTASAILGLYFANNIFYLALCCVPMGLGAGAIDTALNSFVGRYYSSRDMSWLHGFWGVGASCSALIVSAFADSNWRLSFLTVSLIQFVMVVILFASLPLWKKVIDKKEKALALLKSNQAEVNNAKENLTSIPNSQDETAVEKTGAKLRRPLIFRSGVLIACMTFFLYCSLENITGVWGNTYLVNIKGFSTGEGALVVSLFYIGITVGRFATGFLTAKIKDQPLVIGGVIISGIGALCLTFLTSHVALLISFALIGVGCAPIYPCSMKLASSRFGLTYSPEIIGYQSAFGGLGITCMTPLFGIVANATAFSIFPFVLSAFAVLQIVAQTLTVSRAKQID